MTSIAKQTHRFTYADYLTWDDETRWELIDGEAYAMAPAPTTRHQMIVQNLSTIFGNHFHGKPCRPFTAPTDVKLSNFDVVQPDLVVVCDPDKITEAAIVGAPNLVVEITSSSTEARDRREKRALYERSGIPEYWLVSPNGFVEVHEMDANGRYQEPVIFKLEETLVSRRFTELTIEVNAIFEDVPIERAPRLTPPTGQLG